MRRTISSLAHQCCPPIRSCRLNSTNGSLVALITACLPCSNMSTDRITSRHPVTWPVPPRSGGRCRMILPRFRCRFLLLHSCLRLPQSKQRKQSLICSFWLNEVCLARERCAEHLLHAILRQSCRSQIGLRQRPGLLGKREGQGADEVQFEQTNAADTSCIQHLPVLFCQGRFFFHW